MHRNKDIQYIISPTLPDPLSFKDSKRIKWDGHYYICVKCPDCARHRWQRGDYKKRVRYPRCNSCAQKGNRNYKWQGYRRANGYIKLNKPGYHRADSQGYVMEHIVVWEKANNKELPKGWVVHHLNGIKDDNRPENLLALHYSKHHWTLLMKELQERIRHLEAKLGG